MNKLHFDTIPAKLMLFGEYLILKGGNALVIPLHLFSGKFMFGDLSKDEVQQSNTHLKRFYTYLRGKESLKNVLKIDDFEKSVQEGLYFKSDIPVGYGVGSSGALVAGVLKGFSYADKINKLGLSQIKDILGEMESFFHGNSSGVDPLACFVNKPLVLIGSDIKTVELDLSYFQINLLNLKQMARTKGFVGEFMRSYNNNDEYKSGINHLIGLNNKIISSLIARDLNSVRTELRQMSEMQMVYFKNMLPEKALEIIRKSLITGESNIKLCGSGGGGFLLQFKFSKVDRQLPLKIINVS